MLRKHKSSSNTLDGKLQLILHAAQHRARMHSALQDAPSFYSLKGVRSTAVRSARNVHVSSSIADDSFPSFPVNSLSGCQEKPWQTRLFVLQLSSTPDEPAADGEEPCIVCLENKKSIGFLHQGTMHLCACRGCAEKWFQEHKTCPMCNMPADTLVPVYS